jgi:Reverse transcriptase (RNA-dependent DNA polymerase)
MVRYADDLVVGFQHESDARRFWDAMRDRLRKFSLSLHPDKTRLIEFGRFAAQNCKKRGLAKPETFKFLGFVLICDKSRRGDFRIRRKSRRDRMRVKLQEIKEALQRRTNRPIPKQGNGLLKSSQVTSPTTPCRPMAWRWPRFDITSKFFGIGSYVGVAKEQECYGRRWRNWQMSFSRSRRYSIRGPACGSPLDTQGRSRVPELGSLGSVRGALRNERPYRECENLAECVG